MLERSSAAPDERNAWSASAVPDETRARPPARPRVRRHMRRRTRVFLLLCLALLVAGGVGLGVRYDPLHLAALFGRGGRAGSPKAATPPVGQVFFESSGQTSGDTSAGINDEVQIDLFNIVPPPPGTSYYAWLVSGSVEGKPILLGRLTVNNGQARLLYQGDTQHTNLLLSNNRFLITEEDAASTPNVPSPDRGVWRYGYAFSQVPNTQESPPYSLLDHLHHLLSSDPDLDLVGLYGGLNTWLFRDTQKLLEWAGAALAAWGKDPGLIHRQLVRIMEYLDGWRYALQFELPQGTPLLVDKQIGLAALLELNVAGQEPPGLLYHTGQHLQGIVEAPGASRAQRTLAARLDADLNAVQNWLGQLHRDATELVQFSPQALARPSTLPLLDDLANQALYAFSGRMALPTGTLQEGVMQVYDQMPELATMDIVPVHCPTGFEATPPPGPCL